MRKQSFLYFIFSCIIGFVSCYPNDFDKMIWRLVPELELSTPGVILQAAEGSCDNVKSYRLVSTHRNWKSVTNRCFAEYRTSSISCYSCGNILLGKGGIFGSLARGIKFKILLTTFDIRNHISEELNMKQNKNKSLT